METFLTLLIWLGSGFALAVGFTIGMIVMAIAVRNEKKTADMNAETIGLLRERNAIGARQAAALEAMLEQSSVDTCTSNHLPAPASDPMKTF